VLWSRIAGLASTCACVLALASSAQAQPRDAGVPGAATGSMADAGVVAPARDASVPALDARAPALGSPAPALADAGVEPPPDARPRPRRPRRADAGVPDAPVDAAVDAGIEDAGIVEIDAGVAPVDAGVDAASEASVEQERAVDAPVVEAAPEGPPASAESSLFALKLIFGLAILLVLAYIGGHPRVLRLQERIGIRGVILAGFPFVALGVVASLPEVGVLTDDVIPKLRPLLQFGLGWIGFIIGAQLDIRVLDRVPRGSAYLILIESLAPFMVTALVCGAVMIGAFGLSLADLAAWRDIVLLGAAAAMTAPRRFHGFANSTWHEGRSADVLLGQLDEIVGVIGLLFIMAYFRSDTTSAWQLPGTAWLFVSVGLGVVIGVVIFAMIRLPRSSPEFLAIVLGVVAFASGLASVLQLSPLVTCFLVGVVITNFPNDQRENVFKILSRLERPIHLLFLMIAGALWSVFDWRGWALVPLFVVCRITGKWLGVVMTRASLGAVLPLEFTERRKLVLPMSTMAIALVVSIERFRDVGLTWVVTAVIGGSIMTELLVRTKDDDDGESPVIRRATPIDELDDLDVGDRGGKR
jgi:Kef-type K+ transport system membrane component KefB